MGNSITTQAVLFEGALALLGAGLALLCGLDLGKAFCVPDVGCLFQQIGIGLTIAAAMAAFFWILDKLPLEQFQQISDYIKGSFLRQLKNITRLNRFLICFTAGLGEEILFRGFIQIAVMEYCPYTDYSINIILGVAVSALIFGVAHAISPLYAALSALAGIVFSMAFLQTGFLIAPIIAHVGYDFWAIERLIREEG